MKEKAIDSEGSQNGDQSQGDRVRAIAAIGHALAHTGVHTGRLGHVAVQVGFVVATAANGSALSVDNLVLLPAESVVEAFIIADAGLVQRTEAVRQLAGIAHRSRGHLVAEFIVYRVTLPTTDGLQLVDSKGGKDGQGDGHLGQLGRHGGGRVSWCLRP